LAIVNFPSDEDDDGVARLIQKQREFLRKKKFATLGERLELVNKDGTPAEGNRSENEESCVDETAGLANELGNDDEEPECKRKSKYSCYDLTIDKHILFVSMKFNNTKQLKEVVVVNAPNLEHVYIPQWSIKNAMS